MKNKKKKDLKQQGITLITLVITMIILLILATVTISILTKENGILIKSQKAKEETNKKTATEIINLKITNIQIESYAQKQEMPDLQYLANQFCKDEDMQYVALETKKNGALEEIEVGKAKAIFVKLKEYPYEFEIDKELKLASIDGINIGNKDNSYQELYDEIQKLKEQNNAIIKKVETLEKETIMNQRINLMNTKVEVPLSTNGGEANIDITLNDSIEEYKWLEIQIDVNSTIYGKHLEKTIIIATEQLQYNNSNTVNWENESTFQISCFMNVGSMLTHAGSTCWFKDNKTLHIGGNRGTDRNDFNHFRIHKIYGIK